MSKISVRSYKLNGEDSLRFNVYKGNKPLLVLIIRIIKTSSGLYTIPKPRGNNLCGLFLPDKTPLIIYKTKEPWLPVLFGRSNNIIYMTIDNMVKLINQNINNIDKILSSDLDLKNLKTNFEVFNSYIRDIIGKDIYNEEFLNQYLDIFLANNGSTRDFNEDIKNLYGEERFYDIYNRSLNGGTDPFFILLREDNLFNERVEIVPLVNKSERGLLLKTDKFKSYMTRSSTYKDVESYLEKLGYSKENEVVYGR